MGTSRTTPNDWMVNTGNGLTTPYPTSKGWCIKHPNGLEEVIQCMDVATAIKSVTNPPDGSYSIAAGDIIQFGITWSEEVSVAGVPQILFNEASVQQAADYNASKSSPTFSVFEYIVTTEGNIDTVFESINLNGGTIVGVDGYSAVLTFPSDYTQPTGVVVVA